MNRRFFLVLLIALCVCVGIQTVSASPVAENGTAREPERTVIDLGSATDEEFAEALESALELEWVNKNQMPLEEQPMLAQEDSAEQPVLIEAAADEETPPDTEVIIIVEENPDDTEVIVIVEENPDDTEVIVIVEENPDDTEVIVIVEENPDDTEVIIIVEETPEDTEVIVIEETPADTRPSVIARETSEETIDPDSFRNNQYFLESQRYAKLAEEAYTYGDYDASAGFAEEAIRYALLSDEYIARRLKGESEADAIAALDASKEEPARKDDDTIVIVETPAGKLPLPARYTVRTWGDVKDCFWNIAGRPWVYGDPRQWRVLYDANKTKLPDPNNPNWIEPGMILDIPSIKGEAREGTWDSNKTYDPIR